MSALDIKWGTIVEKWGRISGMLEGGSVNLTPSMYVFNFLFKITLFIKLVSFSRTIDLAWPFVLFFMCYAYDICFVNTPMPQLGIGPLGVSKTQFILKTRDVCLLACFSASFSLFLLFHLKGCTSEMLKSYSYIKDTTLPV